MKRIKKQIPESNPFPKWKWMMDYCRERRWHPSDFWDLAEKAWRKAKEAKP